jgi:hypothetical protein
VFLDKEILVETAVLIAALVQVGVVLVLLVQINLPLI